MAPSAHPRVLVPYGYSAATPMQILTASEGLCDVVYLLTEAAPQDLVELLSQLGEVLVADGDDAAFHRVRDAAVDGIVTFSDDRLELTAWLAARLGLRHASEDSIRRGTSKPAQREALHQAGVDVTRFRVIDDPQQLRSAVRSVGVPAVVKPTRGSGSAFTYSVPTWNAVEPCVADLESVPRSSFPFIVEEQLESHPDLVDGLWGDYVSTESVVVGGEVHTLAVTAKAPLARPFREQGGVVPCPFDEDRQAAAVAVTAQAVAALGIEVGLTHTELKLTPDCPRVIEVNPRLGGHQEELVLAATGVSLVETAMRAALGLPVPTGMLPTSGVAWWCAPAPEYGARRIRKISGIEEVARLPGVLDARARVQPGTWLHTETGWGQYLLFSSGWSASHPDYLRTRQGIIDALQVEYD